MKIDVDDSCLNDLMREGLAKAINMARRAHYTDLCIRIDGRDVQMEADWLKHMRIQDD